MITVDIRPPYPILPHRQAHPRQGPVMFVMRFFRILATLGGCVIAQRAAAQVTGVDPLAIPTGTEARITETSAPGTRLRVTVMSTDQDTLRFHLHRQADARAVAWREVSQMDVSDGGHGHFWQGLGIGLLTGAVVGVVSDRPGARSHDPAHLCSRAESASRLPRSAGNPKRRRYRASLLVIRVGQRVG